MYQSLIFFLGTMILIRSLTFTFLWCFEKTRSSGMNEALLFNYSFSISRSSKSLITDLARWSVDLKSNNGATFILGKPQITPTPHHRHPVPHSGQKNFNGKNSLTRQCQIRVRFESRGSQIFKALGKCFLMTKYAAIIMIWCIERGFYKRTTWSPVLGVFTNTWQRIYLY